ncbi:hypothetical protein Misp01_48590 [Microtetraspora sp. NBRC 13810]|uniref:hypothetical protein n=1 Tax=Microtetraspora sp. NBRC 13810 TaxID=3030990 RepID=UPI0024A3115D|nr:hypothetical protein [Microtetraspora sp. NBRC 13810]GLW09730.1 hypothetical protein Misp01_48590 [Microtetraspora sp. NBRC 13810]
MRDTFTIDDLPAGVSELAGEELEIVAGIQAQMKPGSGYACSSAASGMDCKND